MRERDLRKDLQAALAMLKGMDCVEMTFSLSGKPPVILGWPGRERLRHMDRAHQRLVQQAREGQVEWEPTEQEHWLLLSNVLTLHDRVVATKIPLTVWERLERWGYTVRVGVRIFPKPIQARLRGRWAFFAPPRPDNPDNPTTDPKQLLVVFPNWLGLPHQWPHDTALHLCTVGEEFAHAWIYALRRDGDEETKKKLPASRPEEERFVATILRQWNFTASELAAWEEEKDFDFSPPACCSGRFGRCGTRFGS